MKRYIGLRNIVTSKSQWKYLILYETDGEKYSVPNITELFSRMQTSFVCYQTLNGFHFVGLSPLDSMTQARYFTALQNRFPEYYSGQTLRVSLKEGETQKLLAFSFRYPYIPRLASIYIKRFKIDKSEIPEFTFADMPYVCVFEKYWTGKID